MHGMSRKAASWAGALVAMACLALFLMQAIPLLGQGMALGKASAGRVPGTIGGLLAAYACAALAWHFLLGSLGPRPGARLNAGIFATSQFAKYLPGNIGQHVGRVVLARHHGLPTGTVVAAMAMEIVVIAGLAGLGALPALGYMASLHGEAGWSTGWTVAGLALGGVVLGGMGVAWARRSREAAAPRPGRREQAAWFALGTALTAATLVLGALAMGWLDTSGRLLQPGNLVGLLSVFCAAWLLGFLTPGAPAGLGVRELTLMAGLSPMVGEEAAAAIALLFRMASTIVDVLVFGAGLWALKPYGHAGAVQEDGSD